MCIRAFFYVLSGMKGIVLASDKIVYPSPLGDLFGAVETDLGGSILRPCLAAMVDYSWFSG